MVQFKHFFVRTFQKEHINPQTVSLEHSRLILDAGRKEFTERFGVFRSLRKFRKT